MHLPQNLNKHIASDGNKEKLSTWSSGRVSVVRRLPQSIGFVGRQQPNNKPSQLASGKDISPFVLMFADFVIFALVVGFVLRGVQSHHLSGFAEVVAEEAISSAGQRSILSFEIA